MKFLAALFFPFLCIILCFYSCTNSTKNSTSADSIDLDTTIVAKEDTILPAADSAGAVMIPAKNLIENINNSPNHTTLATAINAAELAVTFSGPGPFTIFAPTNSAFSNVDSGLVQNLLKPGNKQQLQNFLTYHVISGTFKTTDIKNGMELTTVEGAKLKFTIRNDSVFVNRSPIILPDIVSNNGVVHVIGGILTPPVK